MSEIANELKRDKWIALGVFAGLMTLFVIHEGELVKSLVLLFAGVLAGLLRGEKTQS